LSDDDLRPVPPSRHMYPWPKTTDMVVGVNPLERPGPVRRRSFGHPTAARVVDGIDLNFCHGPRIRGLHFGLQKHLRPTISPSIPGGRSLARDSSSASAEALTCGFETTQIAGHGYPSVGMFHISSAAESAWSAFAIRPLAIYDVVPLPTHSRYLQA